MIEIGMDMGRLEHVIRPEMSAGMMKAMMMLAMVI